MIHNNDGESHPCLTFNITRCCINMKCHRLFSSLRSNVERPLSWSPKLSKRDSALTLKKLSIVKWVLHYFPCQFGLNSLSRYSRVYWMRVQQHLFLHPFASAKEFFKHGWTRLLVFNANAIKFWNKLPVLRSYFAVNSFKKRGVTIFVPNS